MHRYYGICAALVVAVSLTGCTGSGDDEPASGSRERFDYACQPDPGYRPDVFVDNRILPLEAAIREGYAAEAAAAVQRTDKLVRDYAYSHGLECIQLYETYIAPHVSGRR